MTSDRRVLSSKLSSIITNISFPNTSARPTFRVSNTGRAVARRTKELLISIRKCRAERQSQVPLAAITELNGTDLRSRQAAIGILPDDVLLDIFSFYVDQADKEDEWHALLHVCRRWRNVVFGSPRRLHLTLAYDPRRPVGEMLGKRYRLEIAKTRCRDVPAIPMLTSLRLSEAAQTETRLPDSFLAGSAPRLRSLTLIGISFPALPNLLLSASDLVHLDLWDIPDSGYIPPDAMAVCLSMLTRLKTLYFGIHFRVVGGTSHPLPPLSRTLLHALTTLRFSGNSEYLEDFISRIDVPLLNDIDITFSDLLAFDTPEFLRKSASRSAKCQAAGFMDQVRLTTSSLVRFCRSSLPLPLLSVLECLDIYAHAYYWLHNARPNHWLELLGLFASVKSLSLFDGLVPPVMAALGELVGGRDFSGNLSGNSSPRESSPVTL
ncbi:hypothetical protein BJV74DRAFT_884173 [Russula compacta]|nr:hypothetical protein BJV74DRAFT_884173 [Russula compacta]